MMVELCDFSALTGLLLGDAQKLQFYMNFREPIHDKNKEALSKKVGVNKTLEFLESIDNNIPNGLFLIRFSFLSIFYWSVCFRLLECAA